MSTFVINQNNIEAIYYKCYRYIAANEYQYERLSWQIDILERVLCRYMDAAGRSVMGELYDWRVSIIKEYNKIADSFALAKQIAMIYHASSGGNTTVFQELHVSSKDIENILLCY